MGMRLRSFYFQNPLRMNQHRNNLSQTVCENYYYQHIRSNPRTVNGDLTVQIIIFTGCYYSRVENVDKTPIVATTRVPSLIVQTRRTFNERLREGSGTERDGQDEWSGGRRGSAWLPGVYQDRE